MLSFGVATAVAQQADCTGPSAACGFAPFVLKVELGRRKASAVYLGPGQAVTNRHVVLDATEVTLVAADGRKFLTVVEPSAFDGDLVLLRAAELNFGKGPAIVEDVPRGSDVFVFSYDAGRGRPYLFPRGELVLPPDANAPGSRIQHQALGSTGSDGGALILANGALVGIATTGRDGISEAIPVRELRRLRANAGVEYLQTHQAIGQFYKRCIETQAQMPKRRARLARRAVAYLSKVCTQTGNAALIEGAAQILGRAGNLKEARDLFSVALTEDSHALNARIGLVVTLLLGGGHLEALTHLKWLRGVLPKNTEVMRLSIQAGKHTGDVDFARDALNSLERLNPALALPMQRFLDSAGPAGPRR
ncbi:MAG: trypsin-like peptidase domain-containing protein [Rhodospirillaceae bacterium]|nr:trypsin-like peptidase domain-containing protein [Rhodospirillaceae bacterium]